MSSARSRWTAAGVYNGALAPSVYFRNTERTSVIAALVALIVGLRRSAFGAAGGRAAVCGDAGSGERAFADGSPAFCEGTTTGGVCPNGLFGRDVVVGAPS